jgi:hypothetical protein
MYLILVLKVSFFFYFKTLEINLKFQGSHWTEKSHKKKTNKGNNASGNFPIGQAVSFNSSNLIF